jgi:hypothetical protein
VRKIPSRTLRAAVLISMMAAVLGCTLALPAAAQDRSSRVDTDDQIVLNGRLIVPRGQSIGSGVIFNGPAIVEGTVRETLVVFHGRVVITGRVGEDVVVFNGNVLVRRGARINGDLVTRQTPRIEQGATIGGSQQRVATKFDFKRLGIASRFAWWIAFSISILILGLILLALAPGLDGAIIDAVRRRTGASIGFGAGLFFLIPIAAVILLVLIVTIPLGLFLLLSLALIYGVGYALGVLSVGRLLIKPPSSRFVAFLVGWAILRALALIPVLGGLLWLAAAILGLGSLMVAARRRTPGEAPAAVPAPAPASPAPPPPA